MYPSFSIHTQVLVSVKESLPLTSSLQAVTPSERRESNPGRVSHKDHFFHTLYDLSS